MEKGIYAVFVAVAICLFADVRADMCVDKLTACSNKVMNVDPSTICTAYADAKACVDNLKDTCGSSAMYSPTAQGIDTIGQACNPGGGSSGGCMQDASKCMMMIANMGSGDSGNQDMDPSTMCVTYDDFKTCMQPVEQKCADDPNFATIKTQIDSMKTVCESGCEIAKLGECIKNVKSLEMTGLMTVKMMNDTCTELQNMLSCMAPILESCKALMAQDPEAAKQSVQQQEMARKMTQILCVEEMPKLLKYSSCIDDPAIQGKFGNCEKMYGAPAMDDQGSPMSETEAEQCQRMKDMSDCITTATEADCGEDAAQAFTGLNQRMMSIKLADDNLNCPTDAASSLFGHFWVFGISVILAALLY